MYENKYGVNKIIITMPEMMEQMDCSDKTIYKLVQEGELPDFTYGSKWNKKKGWHTAVLERHAMAKYEKSQSLQHICNPNQILAQDMAVMPLSSSNRAMAKQSTDLDNWDTPHQKLCGKEMSKSMRSPTNSRIATGFADI